ncbi:uncharacterized protein [Drosophila kikkawai]|uniref:Uncharacterized protein isoform X1 n=1 Tax=Drosophila kikkawai TaxID=30033 RepID=A0ABM4GF34_DROKI
MPPRKSQRLAEKAKKREAASENQVPREFKEMSPNDRMFLERLPREAPRLRLRETPGRSLTSMAGHSNSENESVRRHLGSTMILFIVMLIDDHLIGRGEAGGAAGMTDLNPMAAEDGARILAPG